MRYQGYLSVAAGMSERGARWCAGSVDVVWMIPDQRHDLSIWERERDLLLEDWLEAHLDSWPNNEHRVDVHRGQVDVSCLVAHLPECELRARLASDLDAMCHMLIAVAPSPKPARIKIELGKVQDDQCRKFHVDKLRLRVLSTYLGPGTEWICEDSVDRRHVGGSACCPADANRAILRDPAGLRRARTGDVLFMKGTAWPGNEARGLVHRSPSIAGRGVTRLVFVATVM